MSCFRRTLLATCLCIVSVSVHVALGAEPSQARKDEADKKVTVARVAIRGALPESVQAPGIFGELEPNLANLLRRLEKAAEDKQVAAVVLQINDPDVGRAKAEAIRRAIAKIRAAKKQVVAQIQDNSTTADYTIACACDKIVMPESGTLMLPGVRLEVTYYKGLLDLVGIQAEMMQVGNFKGAAEPYTRNEMSPEYRAQLERVLDDFYQQLVSTIQQDRKLEAERVRELIDQGLFTARAAKEAGLIDQVAYEDELEAMLKESLHADTLEMADDYGQQKVEEDFSGMMGMMKMFELLTGTKPTSKSSSAKKIAVVHAVGMITSGEGGFSLFGESAVGSTSLIEALQQASDDEHVAAIVLRIDSPGGSALASDLIWREIQQIEKPVVASMGDTAASGGYYLAMGADRIFAEAGTLTGSIGVVGGKVVLKGLYDKLGIRTEVISRGKNSGLLSYELPMSDSERRAMRGMMEEVYRQFVAKASEGRKIDPTRFEDFAAGRVWSGRQAKEHGLVDEIGGLRDAVTAAKQLAGLKEDEKTELWLLPEPRSFLDQLLGGEPLIQAPASALNSPIPAAWQAPLQDAAALGQIFREPALLLMPQRLRIR